jgi:hypothetical protein
MISNSCNCCVLAVSVVMTAFVAGCGQSGKGQVTLEERVLLSRNPTNYEFNASIIDTKAAIQKAYDDWHYDTSRKYEDKLWAGDGDAVTTRVYSQALQLIGHEQLFWKGDADALSKGLLTKPGNENDAYLYGGDAPYCESQVYFKNGVPLIYYADFELHLTALNAERTRVEILTLSSKVAAGIDRRFSPVRGPGLILVDVPSTTIEEYQILRKIGLKLGTRDMAPVVTPGSNAPVRQLTRWTRGGS